MVHDVTFSVITPHYRGTNPYIAEAYASLAAQTYGDWEWIVVLNNGGELPTDMRADDRVRPVMVGGGTHAIGWLKWYGAQQAQGDILVELDADDMLTPDALEELAVAFRDEQVQFAYSNFAEFEHATWKPFSYSADYGWRSRPFTYQGHELTEMIAFPPTPHALRYVYWAPNHVRAWRRTAYEDLGGHNGHRAVGDDHDLVCRTYLAYGAAGMRHVDKCLYLYRRHGDNTSVARNADVQAATQTVYRERVRAMVERWCADNDLAMLNIGAGEERLDGYTTLDKRPPADILWDLEDGIPIESDSVGLVRAYDVLEHLSSPVRIMNEIYRVLAPGGWLFLRVPSTDGRGAFQDPSHKSFWNENSLWYYTEPAFAKYVPECYARFQLARAVTWYPTAWHEQYRICYLDAQLIAVKPGYEPIGECLWLAR